MLLLHVCETEVVSGFALEQPLVIPIQVGALPGGHRLQDALDQSGAPFNHGGDDDGERDHCGDGNEGGQVRSNMGLVADMTQSPT